MSASTPRSESRYVERADARSTFDEDEIRTLRFMLRRLRFLERQVKERGGIAGDDGVENTGGVFAEMEMAGLVFLLTEIGYAREKGPKG